MIDKDILKTLKPLKRKYYLTKLVKYILSGTLYYSIALLLMMVLSKIVPIPYILSKSIKMFFISMLITIIYSIYKRPKDIEIAKIIDSFGLKERVVTSLEFLGDNSEFSMMQKKDTLDSLKDGNLRKKIEIKYPKKTIIATVIILISSIALGNINTSSVSVAKNIEKDKKSVEEEKENIEKVIQETKKDNVLNETEKKEIENTLRELKKTLDKSKDLKDREKDILKSKKELEKLRDKLKNEELEKLAKKLSKKDLTKNLSKEILNKNKENISKEMKDIEDKLKNMNKKELENAISDLKDLEKSIENKNIKDAINNLTSKLNENIDNLLNSDMNNDISKLSDQIKSTLDNESHSSNSLNNSISVLDGMMSESQSFKETNGSDSDFSGANGSGSGKGSGSGSGVGKGSGQGSGIGSGSDSGSENVGNEGGSQTNSSKDKSDGGVKEYEKIHTPKHQNAEGYDAQISGIKGSSEDIDNTQTKKFGDKAGEPVPYNEVLSSYKKSAYEKIDSEEIPSNMKDVVKKYFIELD